VLLLTFEIPSVRLMRLVAIDSFSLFVVLIALGMCLIRIDNRCDIF
jgi:hypothetical protein